MRARENGKYLLRSTNDGITAIVDDSGDVVARLPRFEAGVLTGTIHTASGTTPYSRWLHLPLWAALGVCAIIGLRHTRIRSYSQSRRNRTT